jgi:hypothetical protein
LRAAGALRLALATLVLAGCAKAPQDDPAKMALLKDTYAHLHERLEKAAAKEPLVATAFAARGQVVLAMRSGLIEELAGNVGRRYLDRVTVDLSEIDAESSGELRKDTFLGRMKVGDWHVALDMGKLVGQLRGGTPRVRLHPPDLIDVELPVEVQPAEGNATLRFGWDSAGLANVVCKDFDLTQEIRGRVLAQRHVVSGALRLENTGETLTATPVFPDRRFRLKIDLTPDSWGVVEAALRTQDTFGKCGMMMDPERGLERLKELAARGINVTLPDSLFRIVSLPARLQKLVKVDGRMVGLGLAAQSLRVEGTTLWSSVSFNVQAAGTVQAKANTKP